MLLSSKHLEAEANQRGHTSSENNLDLADVKEVKDLRRSSEQLHNSSLKEPEAQSHGVVIAEPAVAEQNPACLQMQQTPIKVEAEVSPTADYNPTKQAATSTQVSNQAKPAQEQSGLHG